MERFWKIGKTGFGHYDFNQLIDTRILSPFEDSPLQIICDIDKTYLETKFESKVEMLKIAFEEAKDKKTVPGASAFLLALRWEDPYGPILQDDFKIRPLHFVSASPPLLRKTLEEKLQGDGLDWNSDTFKNQVYNLRKVRLDLLRHHVAYKTATLYSIMRRAKAGTRFILIGDNAEFDAYIYLGLSLYLSSKLNQKEYIQYLMAGGIIDEEADDMKKMIAVKPDVKVEGILIREAPGHTTKPIKRFSQSIFYFTDYYQALMQMIYSGFIEVSSLDKLSRRFHNQSNFSRESILAHLAVLKDQGQLKPEQRLMVEAIEDEFMAGDALGVVPKLGNYLRPFSLQDNASQEGVLEDCLSWAQSLAH